MTVKVATNAFTQKDLQLTQTLANQAAIAIQNSLYATKIEQEALTRERMQRLLSPAIAEQVINGAVDVAKGGQVRDTTIFFSDIRGFTSMSESRDAQDIVDMLNEYFELMVEVIFKYEGTLDKFVGDEIMALFGSPVQHPDDPVRAVRTAVEQMRVLAEFNNRRLSRGEDPVRIGIGNVGAHVPHGGVVGRVVRLLPHQPDLRRVRDDLAPEDHPHPLRAALHPHRSSRVRRHLAPPSPSAHPSGYVPRT
jgi:class 3 adenylate cyclase